MGQAMPPGGWPLRLAIYALAPPERRQVAEQCEALLSQGQSFDSLYAANRILWLALVGRHQNGELAIEARPAGQTGFIQVAPQHLHGATPDYKNDALINPDVSFYNVRISETKLPCEEHNQQAALDNQKSKNWTTQDVERWFRERFAETPKTQPWFSETQDIEEAKGLFPGVQRECIRSLREQYVPSDRRKQGRRQINANPPPKTAQQI